MKAQPDFRTPEERDKWIVDNADYFTTIQLKDRQYLRQEHQTLPEAERWAKNKVAEEPHTRILIYAVAGIHDTFVRVILGGK